MECEKRLKCFLVALEPTNCADEWVSFLLVICTPGGSIVPSGRGILETVAC